jgi:hypothetical protein
MCQKFDSLRQFIFASLCTILPATASLAQPVTLRPVDTGRSVVTFDLGVAMRPDVRYAVKTNALYLLAFQTPNFAFEYGLGPRTSVEAAIGYNKWSNLWDNSTTGPDYDPNNRYKRRIDHLFIKAEYHYWLRNRFEGHFVGGGLFFANYNVGEFRFMKIFDKGFDYYGNLIGIGGTYGWLWRWHHRWAAEFTVGLGLALLIHDKSSIGMDGEEYILFNPERLQKLYFGPTGVGIKLVFTIK